MRWNQILLEKEIPHSSYGYWITDTGEFLSVPYEGHQKVAYNHSRISYVHALHAGWIRIDIVELLKNPIIKKIEGGGYLPQNNFSLNDLPDNLRDEIISYKKW